MGNRRKKEEQISQPEILIKEKNLAVSSSLTENSMHEMLCKASPFQMKHRISDWFKPVSNQPILNEESTLVHNFAWAVNDIIWEFGLKYPRKNDAGQFQPAIAMLCQVKHQLYPEPKLFQITVTFDHILEEQSPNKISYNSTWECYHRTLSRKNQDNETVEEYVSNGVYQFIDFPPLRPEYVNIEIKKSLLSKIYPDGSFIEKVESSIITVRDPKNDIGKNECRLLLFVVK